MIHTVSIWLSLVAAESQALVTFEPSLLLACIPLAHLPVVEDRVQAIKASRTKAVDVFMLALTVLNTYTSVYSLSNFRSTCVTGGKQSASTEKKELFRKCLRLSWLLLFRNWLLSKDNESIVS